MTAVTQGTKWYTVSAEFTYQISDSESSIQEYLDAVADHLDELNAEDVAMTLDEDTQWFSVSVLVGVYEETSPEAIVGEAIGLMRTAFHACDMSTPEWPTNREAVRFKSVRVEGATLASHGEARLLETV